MCECLTCGQVLVHQVCLHCRVAAVERVLAGRVEVVLQQLPLLAARCEHVAGRNVDLMIQSEGSCVCSERMNTRLTPQRCLSARCPPSS